MKHFIAVVGLLCSAALSVQAQTVSAIPKVCGSAVSTCLLPGKNLVSLYVTPAASGYIMIFNALSAPSSPSATTAGTASGNMQDCIPAPAGITTSIATVPMRQYSVGILIAFSSTGCSTYTASANAFISGVGQ